jgi:hypothetical protein
MRDSATKEHEILPGLIRMDPLGIGADFDQPAATLWAFSGATEPERLSFVGPALSLARHLADASLVAFGSDLPCDRTGAGNSWRVLPPPQGSSSTLFVDCHLVCRLPLAAESRECK